MPRQGPHGLVQGRSGDRATGCGVIRSPGPDPAHQAIGGMVEGQAVDLPEVLQADVQIAGDVPHGVVAVLVRQLDPEPGA